VHGHDGENRFEDLHVANIDDATGKSPGSYNGIVRISHASDSHTIQFKKQMRRQCRKIKLSLDTPKQKAPRSQSFLAKKNNNSIITTKHSQTHQKSWLYRNSRGS